MAFQHVSVVQGALWPGLPSGLGVACALIGVSQVWGRMGQDSQEVWVGTVRKGYGLLAHTV